MAKGLMANVLFWQNLYNLQWTCEFWDRNSWGIWPLNKYTLFDGVTYKTCGYFASCIVFLPAVHSIFMNSEHNVYTFKFIGIC